MDTRALLQAAEAARAAAYAPYSGFAVGAALLCADGGVCTGCNLENAALSPGVCAERVAFFKALSEGKRDFVAVAVVGGPVGAPAEKPCWPCGVCRQVMAEFCGPDFTILTRDGAEPLTRTLSQLLPDSFSLR